MDTRFTKLTLTAALAALVLVIGTTRADDTDVYMNPGNGLPPGSEPMVMFSIDYRPNLAATACTGDECDTLISEGYMAPTGPYTFFDVLRGAMRKVFDPLEGVRVGLMINHNHNTNCEGFGRTRCSNGGYIAMGFETFEVGDTNGAKARFHKILASMPTPLGNLSHSYQGKELFFEFFRYLTGQGVYNAHNGYTDFGTTNSYNLDETDPGILWDQTAIAWDSSIESGARNRPDYVSPLKNAGACSKIYTVNMLFQVSNQDDDSDRAIEDTVSAGGMGSPQPQFPDVVQYLHDADIASGKYARALSTRQRSGIHVPAARACPCRSAMTLMNSSPRWRKSFARS